MTATLFRTFSTSVVVLALLPLAQAKPPTAKPERKPPAPQARFWTDDTGAHKIRATLVGVEEGQVKLKKTDGQVIAVPLDKLSAADQKWLAKHASAAETSAASAGAQWPGWLGPHRDGRSTDTGLLKEWPSGGPTKLWTVKGLGKGFSSPSIAGDTIYVTGEPDDKLHLFAYDLDGKLKWQVAHGPSWTANYPGARSSPTIDGRNLYLLSGKGLLVCYDARQGKPLWSKDAAQFGGKPGGWGYAESVLIHENLAIFKPGGANCIVALDKLSGRDVWTSKGIAAGPEYSSCLAVNYEGASLIVTGSREGLIAVNARNGTLLWNNKFSAGNVANCPTPAYADGLIFWANGYGKGGVCMQLAAGGNATQAWTTSDMVCHHGGYVIDGGYIYGNNGNGWACLDLKSGQTKWSDKAFGKGSLCWADGMLYLFSEKKGEAALAACSPSGLQLKGRVQVEGEGPSWAHPVVTGGRLYLRYEDNLYCFDVKAK